MALKAKTLS